MCTGMNINDFDNSSKPEAIRGLYEVFKRYPARADMPRCEHCAPKVDLEYLCKKALSDLTDDALHHYTWHAISTVGEVVDFKHFLPRIFETMLWAGGSIDAEIVVGKLPYGRWRDWPAQEQEAVSAFFVAWWEHLLSRYPAEHEAQAVLCAIAQAEDDLSPFLDYWRRCPGPEPVRHLAGVLAFHYGELMEDQPLSGPWWEQRPKQMSQLRDWLLSPLTGKTLNEAFFSYGECSFAKQLSDAVEQIEWVQEAMARKSKLP